MGEGGEIFIELDNVFNAHLYRSRLLYAFLISCSCMGLP